MSSSPPGIRPRRVREDAVDAASGKFSNDGAVLLTSEGGVDAVRTLVDCRDRVGDGVWARERAIDDLRRVVRASLSIME